MELHNSFLVRQILTRMEDYGLKGFLEADLESWCMEDIMEFFYHGRVRDNVIYKKVMGTKVKITEKTLTNYFDLPNKGIEYLEVEKPNFETLFRELKKEKCQEKYKASIKKINLKDECRLLADILNKVVEAKTHSHDTLTQNRFIVIDLILKEKKIN